MRALGLAHMSKLQGAESYRSSSRSVKTANVGCHSVVRLKEVIVESFPKLLFKLTLSFVLRRPSRGAVVASQPQWLTDATDNVFDKRCPCSAMERVERTAIAACRAANLMNKKKIKKFFLWHILANLPLGGLYSIAGS